MTQTGGRSVLALGVIMFFVGGGLFVASLAPLLKDASEVTPTTAPEEAVEADASDGTRLLAAQERGRQLERQLATALEKVSAAEERLAIERNVSDPLREKLNQLRLELAAAEAAQQQVAARRAKTREAIKSLREEIKKKEALLTSAQAEIGKARQGVQDRIQQIVSAQNETEAVRKQLRESQLAHKVTEAKLTQAQDTITELKGRIQNLQKQIKELDAARTRAEQRNKELIEATKTNPETLGTEPSDNSATRAME